MNVWEGFCLVFWSNAKCFHFIIRAVIAMVDIHFYELSFDIYSTCKLKHVSFYLRVY
jgi:hypothetical protein